MYAPAPRNTMMSRLAARSFVAGPMSWLAFASSIAASSVSAATVYSPRT
jgi:hypothetical protein